MSYRICFKDDYLEHHGINGQKWGVQHGPPYPLDSSISNGSKLTRIVKKKEAIKNL